MGEETSQSGELRPPAFAEGAESNGNGVAPPQSPPRRSPGAPDPMEVPSQEAPTSEHFDPHADRDATVASGGEAVGGPSLTPTKDFDDVHLGETRTEDGFTLSAPGADVPIPERIGRYLVRGLLGSGGFGRVYEGYDEDLRRLVTLKVPHAFLVSNPEDIEAFLKEGRTLAGLDHPHIVPLYHAERTADGLCVIVSKFIAGSDLGARMKQAPPGPLLAAELVAAIADALHYAHTHRLVHRDVKPRNILIDLWNKPYLTDFGLALREDDFGTGPSFAGTCFYMSPEQARGEGHLVDGRADIFSLGVVFYELLSGERPFRGASWFEMLERIKTLEPKPPRQCRETIPPELERICLKALSKRVTDRYTTASDMADDLRHFLAREKADAERLAAPATDQPALSDVVIPKGLRSFEAADADSFPMLLPGPRDRDGLPETIRFWKSRIDEMAAGKTFRVGLVYGPSGGGKSSFLKAGLLPRLAPRVVKVFLEATAEGTEARLLARLRAEFPNLSSKLNLSKSLAALRKGRGLPTDRKVVIVLDQFEQWLQAGRAADDTELVQALRQCDGGRVQCVLTVRDDFWISITRFMNELEVPLVEAENSAAVDLFPARHARKVLTAFGRAFDALPPDSEALTKDQTDFIDQAVGELAEEDKVVPVHLSLFAEMVKDKPWTPATFKEVGGARMVGARFLEGTFCAATAPPEHRVHERAARAVLQALLPDPGRLTKGHVRSRQQLLEASGYAQQPGAFEELIHLLDVELHLLTPVDPQGSDGAAASERAHYQLTHDYLVPALREWLTRKQRETARGRIKLRLTECAALWNVKHERKQLPTFWEWLDFRIFTRRRDWNEREARMMRVATHHYTAGSLAIVLASALLIWLGVEWNGRMHASALLARLYEAPPARVRPLLRELAPYRRWITPRLVEARNSAHPESAKCLNASLALLETDPGQVAFLEERLLDADPSTILVVREFLRPYQERLTGPLWVILKDPRARKGRRIRAAGALAAYDPSSPDWPTVAPDVAGMLIAADSFQLASWCELLRPLRTPLLAPLRAIFQGQDDQEKRSVAAFILALFVADQPETMSALIQYAGVRQLRMLTDRLDPKDDRMASLLGDVLARGPQPDDSTTVQIARSEGHANAALALFVLDRHEPLWTLLDGQTDPGARALLIQRMGPFGIDPQDLVERFLSERDPGARQALILALGRYQTDALTARHRATLIPWLQRLFREDPDPGVHSASEWVLRRWVPEGEPDRTERQLARKESELPSETKLWYVNTELHTLAIVPGPVEFDMGANGNESVRYEGEAPRHCVRIDRSFAIATKEVTLEQFRRFRLEHAYSAKVSPDERCPVNQVDWFTAARYCRWLSEREGVPESEMCYPPIEQIREGFTMAPDFLTRTGYRLPTEAEWECACRAGTRTSRPFGADRNLLSSYCWSEANADERTHPVGMLMPNPLGLFDALGNIYEWCHDPMTPFQPAADGSVLNDDGGPFEPIRGDSHRIMRGGAFHRDPTALRSASRHDTTAGDPNLRVGFRVARTWRRSAN